MKKEGVRFQVYDLLRIKGEDLRELPMEDRRERLESLFEKIPDYLPIGLSPLVKEKSWGKLEERRKESRKRGVEGFMLKRKDSRYESGRVKGGWYKWKIDPYFAEMVLVSQLGHGKRANLYSDYSLAVWDESGELVTVAKAYSGLTNEEIKEVDRFVRKNACVENTVRSEEFARNWSSRLPLRGLGLPAGTSRELPCVFRGFTAGDETKNPRMRIA